MKKQLSILLIFLFHLLYAPAAAQFLNLSGTVRDKYNMPISKATITLSKVDDPLIISFARSDQRGNFTIQAAPNLPLQITVKKHGYQPAHRLLKDKLNLPITITLLKDTVILIEEVIINRKLKISVKGDTTSYHLDAFRMGGERNLAEALARLPGFEVKEDGKITVNGRAIQKILVEGDDLVAGQYPLLSQNLSPDLIEDVQLIDNFLDDPFLKTASRSDDIALNLKFKDKFKNVFLTDALVELGLTDRYHVNINNILLSKATKLFSLTALNNIGNDITAGGLAYAAPTAMVNAYKPDLSFHPLSDIGPGDVPRLERRRWLDNRSALFSIHAMQPLTNTLTLKLNADLSATDSRRDNALRAQYAVAVDSMFTYQEKQEWKGRKRSLNSTIQLNYLLKANQRVRYDMEVNAVGNRDRSSILLGDSVVQQALKVNDLNISHQLNYVNRFKNKSFLSLDFFYKTLRLPQYYDVLGYDYSPISTSLADHKLHQAVRLAGNFLGARSTYYFSSNATQFVARAGYESQREAFYSAIGASKVVLPTNDYRYKADKKYAEIQLETMVLGDVSIRGLLNIAHLHMQRIAVDAARNLGRFIVLPELRVSFSPSRREKIILAYKRSTRPVGVSQLYKSLIFSGYRYADSYSDSLYFSPTDNVSLSYRFNNTYSQFSFNSNFFYSHSKHNFLTSNWLSEHFNISNRVLGGRNKTLGLFYGASKFIPALSNTLNFSGSFLSLMSHNRVNGSAPRNINNLTNDNTLSLISAYNGVFNYIASVQYNIGKSIAKQHATRSTYRTSFLKYQLTTNLRFPQHLFVQLKAARYQWKNNSLSQRPFFAFDASLQKSFFNNNVSLNLTAWNILDTQKLSFNQSADFYSHDLSYQLMGRIILIGGKFSF